MTEFEKEFLHIRGLQNSDFTRIAKAAHEDNHSVLAPTHIMEKNGDVVGALEIGSIPLVMVWGHTKKMNIRDSLDMLRFYENVVFSSRAQQFILPCKATSPYIQFLKNPKLGYLDCGQFNLFVKKV